MQMSARRRGDAKRGDKWRHSFTSSCCFSMCSSASQHHQPSASHTGRVYIMRRIHIQHDLHASLRVYSRFLLHHASICGRATVSCVVYKCLTFKSRKACVLNSFRWIDHFSAGWGEVLSKGSELGEINGEKCPY